MISLPKAPLYTPFDKGLYQVGPLLRPFGTPFGNSEQIENQIFQIDEEYPSYKENKIQALSERKSKYICESRFSNEAKKRILFFIIERLCLDHPLLFKVKTIDNYLHLSCAHSQHEHVFSEDGVLIKSTSMATDALEAISLEIQEDFSVWTYEGEDDWMAYVSLCSPNHWAAEDKIGRDFFAVHEPVAGAGPMLKTSKKLVESMVHKGPFVRFAWGIATDSRLNHHPEAPPQWKHNQWMGRAFDPQNPQLWVRTERQTLYGFPEERLSLFTIRTYFQNVSQLRLNPELRLTLSTALRSMTPESLIYKGLSESLDSILEWLDAKTS